MPLNHREHMLTCCPFPVKKHARHKAYGRNMLSDNLVYSSFFLRISKINIKCQTIILTTRSWSFS